jgi:hypothetical protein
MEFKSQTPVVNDVRDITISKRGGNVLISFERKVLRAMTISLHPLITHIVFADTSAVMEDGASAGC